MLRTRICALLGIEHPIVLGGMGNATSPELVAAVSTAGGLGVLGATRQNPEELARDAAAIRAATTRPFGLNLLLFMERPGQYDALLAARPKVISTAWAALEQDLGGYVSRAHAVGALAMHMISTVAEAKVAARAGAGHHRGAGDGGRRTYRAHGHDAAGADGGERGGADPGAGRGRRGGRPRPRGGPGPGRRRRAAGHALPGHR